MLTRKGGWGRGESPSYSSLSDFFQIYSSLRSKRLKVGSGTRLLPHKGPELARAAAHGPSRIKKTIWCYHTINHTQEICLNPNRDMNAFLWWDFWLCHGISTINHFVSYLCSRYSWVFFLLPFFGPSTLNPYGLIPQKS